MLFTGGQGSVTHMHFDIDLSHIFHTQFMGKKRILLFPHEEQHKIYRKPWEVLTMVNFEKYYDKEKNKLDYDRFPALHLAKGYELILDHGETLIHARGLLAPYGIHGKWIRSKPESSSTRYTWKNKRCLESFRHAPSGYTYEKDRTGMVV